jgi:hypothetical protein
MPGTKRFWTTADVISCLGICESKFFTMRAMGEMVAPVAKVGNALRFHPREVVEWACAGAPPLSEWEAIKKRRGLVFDGENL